MEGKLKWLKETKYNNSKTHESLKQTTIRAMVMKGIKEFFDKATFFYFSNTQVVEAFISPPFLSKKNPHVCHSA